MTRPTRIYLTILSGALVWCALIVLPAVAGPSAVLQEFFHRICHQLDGRSLHVGGERLAVCARCSGIYFSFLLAVVAYPVFRPLHSTDLPPRWLIGASILPMLLDVAGGMLGVHEVTTATRVISGAFFGAVIAWFAIPVFIGAWIRVIPSPSILKKGLHDA